MQKPKFPTDYSQILNRVENINPLEYGKTRNFIDGAVTYLSPYISRGVISTKQILEILFEKGYKPEHLEKFTQELAWREYFQRVWQHLEDDMFEDIRSIRTGIRHKQMPAAIADAKTGIVSLDKAIADLSNTGYMHNHMRMYTASVACNIGKAYWQAPSQWMYYHLLDGDIASNTCSWQWVTGSFSAKQYFCNQENINRYTGITQKNTFLDKSYDEIPVMDVPDVLRKINSLSLTTSLPEKKIPKLDTSLPLMIYTSYNLDPLWRSSEPANRILLLEPSHFKQFPVSEKVIQFILDLSENIEGIKIFAGEVNELPDLNKLPAIYSKEHPAFNHLPGIKDGRDWIYPEIEGFHNSFFSFWKKCQQTQRKKIIQPLELLRA
jgi:deoxyribodipyrimidine photo-lyase